jgi:signal transduction histidine kinase
LDARRALRFLAPVGILGALAVLFVGWEVVEQYAVPSMSTGWKHASLTIRAGVVTVLGGLFVYLIMRREQRRLAMTAERIRGLLESYGTDTTPRARYANPHLVRCWDMLECESPTCPMRNAPGERCWHVMAARYAGREDATPSDVVRACHDCVVYRRSCPDELTALGESFNTLAFLLQVESSRVDQMRGQLAEREKMAAVGQIAAGFAHEIRNPLSSISSVVQLLRRRGADGPSRRQLDLIDEHIERISGTVRQLIDLVRPTPDQWARIDVAEVIQEAARLVASDPRARHTSVTIDCPRSLPLTLALRDRLQQVLMNLLVNGLDAMPEGGALSIRAHASAERIRVSVADTGQGIDSGFGRRVFEPFFTTKDPGQGVGLGLSVSYNIVAEHGGRIEYKPREQGGTVFTVELPILTSPPGTRKAPNHEPDAEATQEAPGDTPAPGTKASV